MEQPTKRPCSTMRTERSSLLWTAVIVQAMRRTFLTNTARSQRQDIIYFRNPFKLVPVTEIANIADKFTRNEI
jgi:hypothetical protein